MKGAPKAKFLAPALCAAAGLAACQSSPLAGAPVDPASPVAKEVAAIADAERPAPTFQDIPKVPQDQRPPAAWGRAAAEVKAAQAELARLTGPETWTLQQTEAFAAEARAAVRDEPAYARSGGDTETFAREQQKRATPPPPPR